jgi:hypothetical protein
VAHNFNGARQRQSRSSPKTSNMARVDVQCFHRGSFAFRACLHTVVFGRATVTIGAWVIHKANVLGYCVRIADKELEALGPPCGIEHHRGWRMPVRGQQNASISHSG